MLHSQSFVASLYSYNHTYCIDTYKCNEPTGENIIVYIVNIVVDQAADKHADYNRNEENTNGDKQRFDEWRHTKEQTAEQPIKR